MRALDVSGWTYLKESHGRERGPSAVLFIGSSTEGVRVAQAVQVLFDRACDVAFARTSDRRRGRFRARGGAALTGAAEVGILGARRDPITEGNERPAVGKGGNSCSIY